MKTALKPIKPKTNIIMRKCTLSLVMLAVSATGAIAATPTVHNFESAKEDAIHRLESYVNVSPFGHKALAKGAADIATTFVGNAETVNAQYASAMAAANLELGENIYRVRVTLANVGVNKDNTGLPKLLSTTSERNDLCAVTLSDSIYNLSVWRFNIAPEGQYTIGANSGQYIGRRDPSRPELGDIEELVAVNDVTYSINFTIAYNQDKAGFTFMAEDKYLIQNPDGSLAFSDELSDFALWTMSRAYDEKFDLPQFSTDENPVYYMLKNQRQGYLTAENGSRLTCKGTDDYSYWYLVDDGARKGTFHLKNKKDNLVVIGNTSNGNMNASATSTSPAQFFCFMLAGNEPNGWSMTYRYHNLAVLDHTNPNTVMYDPTWKRVQSGAPTFNMNNLDLFTWTFQSAEDAEMEEFINKKTNVVNVLTAYKSYMPWCHKLIDDAVAVITKIEYEDYASAAEATEAVVTQGNNTINDMWTQMNKEARGSTVKISNMRRRGHANASELGWYLSAVETADGATVVNTVSAPGYDGFWTLEPVEGAGNEVFFRIRNQHGVYIGEVVNNKDLTTTTDVESAGTYLLYPYGNYIRIIKSDYQGASLNVNTSGGNLTGYAYTDDGSIWTFETVAVIPHEEGMPDLSTDTERQLYVIRNAADNDDVLLFDQDRVGVTHGKLSADAYCYFVKAADGSDGVQIVSYNYKTRVAYSGNYFWCHKSGWDTDPSFNLYIVPNGIEDKEGFVISHTYPVVDNSCLSNISNIPSYAAGIGMGSAGDWASTSWIFDPCEEVDHEQIFDLNRNAFVAEVESYINAVPWAQKELNELKEKLVNFAMTDFAPDTPDAVNQLKAFYADAMLEIESVLEIEPDGAWVSIANVRRRGNAGTGAYLTETDGFLNTADEVTSAGSWQLVYVSNGRYHLRNADGKYICSLSDKVAVTSEKSEAGMYTLDLLNGYVSLVDRADAAARSLNVDAGAGYACVYAAGDAGSRWVMALSDIVSLSDINVGETSASSSAYYNLQGIRIAPEDLTPGVYMHRTGSQTVKVIVK